MGEKLHPFSIWGSSSEWKLDTLQRQAKRILTGDSGILGRDPETDEVNGCFSSREYQLSVGSVRLYRPEAGCELDVSHSVARHHTRATRFNLAFVDFGSCLAPLINSRIPENLRIREDSERIRVLGFRKPRAVSGPLRTISKMAQYPPAVVKELQVDRIFRGKWRDICLRLHEQSEWEQEDGVIVPLPGGAIIAGLFPEWLIPPEKIIPIDSKRIPLKRRGTLGLGMNLPGSDEFDWKQLNGWMESRMRQLDGKYLRILEAAVASGLTTSAFLVDLVDRGVRPSHVEIVAPVVAQQGVEFTLKTADSLGLDVSFQAGAMYYNLGDFWRGGEDFLQDDREQFIIGNTTGILERFLQLERFTPPVLDGTSIRLRERL